MILAYDIGTSFLKGAVVSSEGAILARAQAPVRMVESSDPESREVDANTWLSGMAMVTAQLSVREWSRLRAVVVSSNGPTLVAVGDGGEPLDFAMMWMDRRPREEAELVAEFTDTPLDPSFYLPKAFWIMRHKPHVYERTRHFLPCAEYITYFLTGNAARVLPSPLYKEYFWNEGAIPQIGLDADKFPPFAEVGELLGTVSSRAEETLGIPAGLPVLAGGLDFVMSIIGTASLAPGRVCDRAGTSEGVNLCWSAPVRDKRLLCFPHIVHGAFNVSAMIASSGAALEWGSRTLTNRVPGVEGLAAEAQASAPGAGRLLFLPFLASERFALWDSNIRGAFLGLTLSHGRSEMARAVFESTGFAVRSALTLMELNDCQISDLRVTGGQSRMPFWCQLRADITGKRVLLSEQEDPDLVGNACVGLYGLEDFSSLTEAAEQMVRFRKTYHPNPATAELYRELFEAFTRVSSSFGEVFRDLFPA